MSDPNENEMARISLNFVPCPECGGHGTVEIWEGGQVIEHVPVRTLEDALWMESNLVKQGGNPQPKYLAQVTAVPEWAGDQDQGLDLSLLGGFGPVVVIELTLVPIHPSGDDTGGDTAA